MKNIFIVVFLLSSQQNMLAGGPWPIGKGNAYVKLSEWWTVFDQHYTDTGLLDPNVTTGIFNTALYVEYGLSDRLTGVVYAPLFSRNYMNNLKSETTGETIVPGEAINSVGDVDLGMRYTITKAGSQSPISVSLILGLPTGQIDGGTEKNLSTGDGEFNQYLKVDFGTGLKLGKVPAYFSGSFGVNNRAKGFSEEFRYGAEFGVGLLSQQLWINTRLSAVESFQNGDTAETVTSTSIFANNTEFVSLGLEANYYVSSKVGLSAGFATALKGQIIAAAPSYSVGIFLDLK